MKRLHVHVSVDDLAPAIRFYSTLFASEPTVAKSDYAKWMLDDPRVNFAISARGGANAGVDHLGIQVEDGAELNEVFGRLKSAEAPVLEQGAVTCCYHQSEKSWITDPCGVKWEAFLTHGEAAVYGDGGLRAAQKPACRGSETATPNACCEPSPELAADTPCCAPKSTVPA